MSVQTPSSVLLQAAWQTENANHPDNVVAPSLNNPTSSIDDGCLPLLFHGWNVNDCLGAGLTVSLTFVLPSCVNTLKLGSNEEVSRIAYREQQVKLQRSLTSRNEQPNFKFLVQSISCHRCFIDQFEPTAAAISSRRYLNFRPEVVINFILRLFHCR